MVEQTGSEREKERERYVFARLILRSPAPKCTYAGMLWLHFVQNDRVYTLFFFRCFDFFSLHFILTCFVFSIVVVHVRKICMRCLWGIISCVSFLFLLILLMFLSISFAPSYRFSAILIFVFFYSFIWCNNGCSWWQKMLYLWLYNGEMNLKKKRCQFAMYKWECTY